MLENEDTDLWLDCILARIILVHAIEKIRYPFFYLLIIDGFINSIIDNGIFDKFEKDYLNKSAENHFDNWHNVFIFVGSELKSFAQNKSEQYNPKERSR